SQETGVKPVYQQNILGLGVKTAFGSSTYVAVGLEQAFELKYHNEDGDLVTLAERYSDFGVALEYKVATGEDTWVPRFGIQRKSLGENRLNIGISFHSGSLELDAFVAQRVGSGPDNGKTQATIAMAGLAYRLQPEIPLED